MKRGERIPQHGHTGRDDGGLIGSAGVSTPGGQTTAPAVPTVTTASSVTVSDSAGNFTGENVEEVLAELAATTGGVTYGTPALTLGTSNTAGSTDEAIRRDATILVFDATVPVTQASSDAASAGVATVAARRDHKHGMPALLALSASTPVQDGGAGSAGSGTAASKDDHKHPGDKVGIVAVIDGGGSAITTGVKLDLQIPFACTITAWSVLLDQSGSIVFDVWKDTEANYPPTVGDTITASAKPTVSAATKASSSTLTGWTTSVSAGDTLRFNVDSITTAQRATLTLTATRT